MQISKTVAITSSLNKVTNSVFDGLGRLSETQLIDPDCTAGSGLVKTDYTYGNDITQNTHYTTVTTPYCNSPGTVFGLPIRTDSDALGRAVQITQTDGTIATKSYVPTTVSQCTTATDEAGKSRTSCTDALGRMSGVWEDPGTPPHLNYETDYGYNLLGDLTSVNQKGDNSAPRTRSFVYDSLSRLTSATNPESGAISYTYSNSSTGCSRNPGTVCTKVAPAPNATSGTGTVTTTYSYDALDRLTQKAYSDGTTPTASFGYDGDTSTLGCATVPSVTDTYPKPLRTGMCDASGATGWAHDQMGRVLTEKRMINGTSAWIKSAGYTYNLDGSSKTISNPGVGRVMAYATNAAGRPVSVVNTGGSINFVTNATYAPFGGLLTAVNGSASGFAGITNTNSYNKRLQPNKLSSASPSQTLFSLTYDFHVGTTDNGNVYLITNNRDSNRTQHFLYDSLNRIQQAYTTGANWGETFGPTATNPGTPPVTPGIDPWGNLVNRSGVTGKTLTEGLSAVANTKNQLAGFGYDIAGNMVSNGSASYTYDAENRVIGAAGWTYVYDGDGRRVKKFSGSTGTLYWPDLSGNTLNESSLGATNLHEYVYFGGKRVARIDVPTPLTVKYYYSDQLGSADVVTDATGNILEESDYFPYGGEIAITNNDGNNYKFTGKERDSETCTTACLDYFGARHYASSLGRFMVPDWAAMPNPVPYANFGNPQTLNLYSYTNNNPTTLTDPDGHCTNLGKQQGFWWCLFHYSDQDRQADAARAAAFEAGYQRWLTHHPGGTRAGYLWWGFNLEISILPGTAGVEIGAEEAIAGGASLARGGLAPVLKGAAGVQKAIAEIEAEGGEILGTEITIENSAGRARVDIAYKNASGNVELGLGEAKNGPTAGLNPNQRAVYEAAKTEGARLVGGNAAKAGLPSAIGPTDVRVFKY
jgi:RHS repeat-associated protein